jgi:hypothetical protein
MDDLDKLLQDARVPTQVSDDLMARILADAQRVQPVPQPFGRPMPARKAGFWHELTDFFGGRGVVAGLASVACAGIYLGAVQPTFVSALILTNTISVDQLDYMPSIDVLLSEE